MAGPFSDMLNRKKILTAVAATALIVRLIFFLAAVDSPFWSFYRIPGLDMATLLRFSEWGIAPEPPYFSFHRLLLWLVWRLNGMNHAPSAVVALQSLGGVLMAVLLADSALRLFRSRWCGIAAGVLAAVYGPFILYEGSILQESLACLLNTAAFWMLTMVMEKDLPYGRIFFCGVLLGAAASGRPVALGFVFAALVWYAFLPHSGRRDRAAGAVMAAGILSVFATVSLFNFFANGSFTPFFKVLEYTRRYNIEVSADPGAALEHPSFNILLNALKRLPELLLPWEIPENLNYHFLAERLFPLDFLPGPALLIPLALAGVVCLAGFLICRKRPGLEFLPLLPLLMLLLPLCAREPIGRYRLLLCPFLILLAAFPAVWLEKCTRFRGYAAVAVITMLWMGSLFIPVPAAVQRRSSDHFTWALAIEAGKGGAVPESIAEIRSAYMVDGNIKYLINLVLRHLQKGEREAAETLLSAAGVSPYTAPADKSICFYYLGVISFENNDYPGMEKRMKQVDPRQLPDELRIKYFYMLGEAAARRRDTVSALHYFQRAIETPAGSPVLREHLHKLITAMLK